jgi:short-subunit dehydrogenase
LPFAGKTALVTGASSGIGRAVAQALAARGAKLVVAGRDRAALSAAFPQATIITHDLSVAGGAAALAAELAQRGLAIDVLVNNAGFGVHGPFDQTDLERELAMVRLQIDTALTLTKAVLPVMKARKRGWLLNVASVYSYAPVPHQAVYGACKAFLHSFSEALASEVRDDGIRVAVSAPGTTKTEFRRRAGAREKGKGLEPSVVAEAALRALERGQLVSIPGFWHKVFVILMQHLPFGLRGLLIRTVNRIRLGK